jgi:hypothetical protein
MIYSYYSIYHSFRLLIDKKSVIGRQRLVGIDILIERFIRWPAYNIPIRPLSFAGSSSGSALICYTTTELCAESHVFDIFTEIHGFECSSCINIYIP